MTPQLASILNDHSRYSRSSDSVDSRRSRDSDSSFENNDAVLVTPKRVTVHVVTSAKPLGQRLQSLCTTQFDCY